MREGVEIEGVNCDNGGFSEVREEAEIEDGDCDDGSCIN